jgi:septum formation topological specificity factor MinE
MPDSWWEESSIIQHERAIGKVEGEVEGLRNGILDVVVARFPHLADLARQKVNQINDERKLRNLLVQISIAQDEAAARSLLASTAA